MAASAAPAPVVWTTAARLAAAGRSQSGMGGGKEREERGGGNESKVPQGGRGGAGSGMPQVGQKAGSGEFVRAANLRWWRAAGTPGRSRRREERTCGIVYKNWSICSWGNCNSGEREQLAHGAGPRARKPAYRAASRRLRRNASARSPCPGGAARGGGGAGQEKMWPLAKS